MKLTTKDKLNIQLQFSEFFEDKYPNPKFLNLSKLLLLCLFNKTMWNYGGIVPFIWYKSANNKTLFKLIKNKEGIFKIITKL